MGKPFEEFNSKDLGKFRKKLGMNQEFFAETINYTKGRISQLEGLRKAKPLAAKMIDSLKDSYPSKS